MAVLKYTLMVSGLDSDILVKFKLIFMPFSKQMYAFIMNSEIMKNLITFSSTVFEIPFSSQTCHLHISYDDLPSLEEVMCICFSMGA